MRFLIAIAVVGVSLFLLNSGAVRGAPEGMRIVDTPAASAAGAFLSGDADCDGELTAKDARIVLSKIAGIPVVGQIICLSALDADNDGDVDAIDALSVLRMVAVPEEGGEIIAFPVS